MAGGKTIGAGLGFGASAGGVVGAGAVVGASAATTGKQEAQSRPKAMSGDVVSFMMEGGYNELRWTDIAAKRRTSADGVAKNCRKAQAGLFISPIPVLL